MKTDYKINKKTETVILTGAGISTDSGLKTFRGSNGYWKEYDVKELARYEAFQKNPELIWEFYKKRIEKVKKAEPNKAHKSLFEMEKILGENFCIITQNVDDLHQRAGNKRVFQMHGNILKAGCIECKKKFKLDKIDLKQDIPLCPLCKSKLRPDVVWFGEIPRFMDEIKNKLNRVNLLIVVGTSGTVYPAASFVQIAKRNKADVICINLDKPDNYRFIDEFHPGKAEEILPKLADKWLS
ncbi:MAG: NAD-dependent deacylase [Candidatus Mcinerneyibacterium aminivorans]|uniref:NAD-dependent protein deacylase n=1 Tax=Candidatus Mcinerneyibacterium aminivorans TaxID=2703815 RepID=A0A5D0MEP4_9BACT|nr:MAG: NAD-dependent deacylase [Candidatus Mcinerneyibacterium aminivorans]